MKRHSVVLCVHAMRVLTSLILAAGACAYNIPNVELKNAAVKGLMVRCAVAGGAVTGVRAHNTPALPSPPCVCARPPQMPAIGLGTGGYSSNPAVGYGGYPECWSTPGGCGAWVQQAVETWLAVGGRRLDTANSYQNTVDVGAAIVASGVPREEIFICEAICWWWSRWSIGGGVWRVLCMRVRLRWSFCLGKRNGC